MGIFTQRGIKVGHNKRTSSIQPVRIEHCETVTLLMKQHIGVPCKPLVNPGDRVALGQVVGDTDAPLAAPIHASISGTVKRLEMIRVPSGEDVQAVVINTDGEMRPAENLEPPSIGTREDFFAAVRASGLVGLGGAGFPAHAKLRSAAKDANILLVNAAECEPYITADHREALDKGEAVIRGIRAICEALEIREAIIGIESNKSDAIQKLKALSTWHSSANLKISVGVLPSRYPQGAEKMMIHTLTGRVVPLGKLPSAVGALVMNVASVAFIGRYIKNGKPLVSRTVTVDGGAVHTPMNVRVPIGIGLEELITFCGGLDSPPAKIILGGPMMGSASPNLETVISKCNNSLLLFTRAQAELMQESACIRCGKCVAGCPMKLMPCVLESAYRAGDLETLTKRDAMGCIECGSCSFVCPAKRELVQRIRMGKRLLREEEAKRKEAAKA
ncbi:MAG: electron transport complex subunit RsxC [Oscillospiraceae bacterium]|jgi:electron transport complex protein RnfC|nr:electron transport complex subunit RsxC [Oscillospiraceae bacterium]